MNAVVEQSMFMAETACERTVTRLRGGAWEQARDRLAEEVPVALEYNGISHAVMLATPSDLEEFALGFSLSEGIVESAREFLDAEIESGCDGITVHIRVSTRAFVALKERRRNLAGRTGCGLCGTQSLAQVLRPLPQRQSAQPVTAAAIRHAVAALHARQPLNQLTGGTHAAAWSAPGGSPHAVFEDVGRHNALDKMIGALAKRRMDFACGFVVITSRASVEMVQKAATVGIPALVALSAPTALAVRTAEDCGMTLIGFARGDGFVAYAHAQHIEL